MKPDARKLLTTFAGITMLTRFFIPLAYAATLVASKVASAVQNTQNNLGETLASKIDANPVSSTINPEAVTNTPGVTDLGIGVAEKIGETVPPETLFSWGSYFQAIAVMFLLLGILWLGLHLLRRSGKFSFLQNTASLGRSALSIESQITIAPKKSLVVVRFLGNHILLGVTEHNITFLKEVPIHDDQHEHIQDNSLSTTDKRASADTKAFERALLHAGQEAGHSPKHSPEHKPENNKDMHGTSTSKASGLLPKL